MKLLRQFFAASALMGAALAIPQDATPEQRGNWPVDNQYATLNLEAGIGSFRSIDGKGRFEVSFKGTFLVSKLKKGGTVSVQGNLRKEYDGMDRTVYTGQGKIIVDGEWRVLQWFGTDMKGRWYGRGLIRVMGEFDRNMNTGSHWYSDPANRVTWFATSVMLVELPSRQMAMGAVKPVRKPMSDY